MRPPLVGRSAGADQGPGDSLTPEFRDFGVFEIRTRAPRTARNPKTLEQVSVPTKKTVKFKVGRLMRLGLESRTETARARPTTVVCIRV